MNELYEAFGRGLKTVRRDRKLTQQQLADRIGLSRTSITNIEKGRQQVSLHQVYFLASALGCQPDELLPAQPKALEDALPSELLEALGDDAEGREYVVRLMGKSGAVRDRTEASG